jgi:hypothetical protein
VENMSRLKPWVVFWGALQRFPFVLAGVILFFFGREHPGWALAAVVCAPFASGLMGGIALSGWFTLTARSLGARRRSSAAALKSILGALIGVAAGWVIDSVLARCPGVEGFAILHWATGACMLVSLLLLASIKEPSGGRPPPGGRGLVETLRSMPGLLRERPAVGRYIAARVCGTAYFLVVPFMSIHALGALGVGAAFLGTLVIAQRTGGIAGNITAGVMGDWFGGRRMAIASRGLFIGLLLLLAFTETRFGFIFIFTLWGFLSQAEQVSDQTLLLELSEGSRMPTYIALSNFGHLLGLLCASSAASLLGSLTEGVGYLIALAAPFVVLAFYLYTTVPEPRQAAATS